MLSIIGDLLGTTSAKAINAMYNNYKVIGLQRTGTNWLNELIKHNFKIEPEVEKTTFWKHLTPIGTKELAKARSKNGFLMGMVNVEDLYLNDTTLYIATSKEYNIWVQSLKRNAEDFYLTHSDPSTTKVYNSWHEWKNSQQNKQNFIYHDYIDWLNNWKDYLEEIHIKTKWMKKHDTFRNTETPIPRNKNFNISNYAMRGK